MNAPQRQIARITFERRHAPQNPLWNARPRSTRQKRIAVYQVERKSEKRSGLKKNHAKRRDGGEKSTNNRVTSMARNSTHFWQTILPRCFSRCPFFFIVFSRLSRFCLLFYFLLYFFFFFVFFSDLGLVGRSIGVGPFLPVRNYNCNYRGFECRSLRELDFFCVFK